MAYGEKRYGETYAQALDITDPSYRSLSNGKWVAEKIESSRRRENLSFSHHAEVAALEPEQQDEWLERAIGEGWSHKELRREIRDWQRGISRKKKRVSHCLKADVKLRSAELRFLAINGSSGTPVNMLSQPLPLKTLAFTDRGE